MADSRGGYQAPRHPAPVSGPGRFSRRTDGQIKATAPLDDPTVQSGDISAVRAAQDVQPIPASPPASQGVAAGAAGAGIPSYIFDSPSNRPYEDVTAGMGQIPPPPPQDDREAVLSYLVAQGNTDLTPMLAEYRQAQAPPEPTTFSDSGMAAQPTQAPETTPEENIPSDQAPPPMLGPQGDPLAADGSPQDLSAPPPEPGTGPAADETG